LYLSLAADIVTLNATHNNNKTDDGNAGSIHTVFNGMSEDFRFD